jgi:hypothetical protein
MRRGAPGRVGKGAVGSAFRRGGRIARWAGRTRARRRNSCDRQQCCAGARNPRHPHGRPSAHRDPHVLSLKNASSGGRRCAPRPVGATTSASRFARAFCDTVSIAGLSAVFGWAVHVFLPRSQLGPNRRRNTALPAPSAQPREGLQPWRRETFKRSAIYASAARVQSPLGNSQAPNLAVSAGKASAAWSTAARQLTCSAVDAKCEWIRGSTGSFAGSSCTTMWL